MNSGNFPEYELAGIENIARGIAVRRGKVLLCRAKGASTTYLPGGHIEFGEKGREALAREMKEEAGLAVEVGEMCAVVENSFVQHGKPHAEINLVYRMKLPEGASVESKESWIGFEWCDAARLDEVRLLPPEMVRLAQSAVDSKDGI